MSDLKNDKNSQHFSNESFERSYLAAHLDPNYLPEYKEASADAQKLLYQIDHG